MKATGIKCLWGTANMFSNPRFMNGAGSTNSADVFCFAAAQVKKALDITVKLGGKGYVFWGGREGYETLLNTDMSLELDNLARLLTMARDYGRKMGIKGDFYIEPKPKEPTKHQYDFDAATCISFLQKYNLMDDFRLNIEGNHATLAGHTFAHELNVARINGVFGSIDANQGDYLLGWDTDQFPTNVYENTLVMLEVLRAGGFKTGGLNFDAKCRRPSNTLDDLIQGFIDILAGRKGCFGKIALSQPVVHILGSNIHSVPILSVCTEDPQGSDKNTVFSGLGGRDIRTGICQQCNFTMCHTHRSFS
jgi:xylose isomerase